MFPIDIPQSTHSDAIGLSISLDVSTYSSIYGSNPPSF